MEEPSSSSPEIAWSHVSGSISLLKNGEPSLAHFRRNGVPVVAALFEGAPTIDIGFSFDLRPGPSPASSLPVRNLPEQRTHSRAGPAGSQPDDPLIYFPFVIIFRA